LDKQKLAEYGLGGSAQLLASATASCFTLEAAATATAAKAGIA
jgi:organic hydroperoxide reductase OsmC/OhrA